MLKREDGRNYLDGKIRPHVGLSHVVRARRRPVSVARSILALVVWGTTLARFPEEPLGVSGVFPATLPRTAQPTAPYRGTSDERC
jgi:hypothetical protein